MCTYLNHLDRTRENDPLHFLSDLTTIIMVSYYSQYFSFPASKFYIYIFDVLKYKPFYRLSAGEFDDEDKIEDVDALLQR